MKLYTYLIVFLFSSWAFADLKDYSVQKTLYRHRPIHNYSSFIEISTLEFIQKLDHFNSADQRTFRQRYFVDENSEAQNKAPVILYICGESTCYGAADSILQEARILKAHVISLEHRYYGYSQPFTTLSTENMRYLTMENAIEDLASFQTEMMKDPRFQGPWLVAGGSYAGVLSAFYRMKHPELVIGSLASSAPVQARVNFEDYDLAVSQAIPADCATQIRSVISEVENDIQKPATHDQIKNKFNASLVKDDVDFLAVVADMAAFAIQYGNKDRLCGALSIAPSQDLVQAYAFVGNTLFSQFGITPLQDSTQGAESENPNDYVNSYGIRQWLYQSCTQFGFFQTAYHDPAVSVRSARINVDFYNSACKRLFNTDPLDATLINQKFYQNLFVEPTSNIIFTNGSEDPWARLSVTHELSNDINPKTFSHTILGASHCSDLSNFNSSPGSAQSMTLEKFQLWLNNTKLF